MLIKWMCLFDVTGVQVNQSAWKTACDDSFDWKTEGLFGSLMESIRVTQLKSSHTCIQLPTVTVSFKPVLFSPAFKS